MSLASARMWSWVGPAKVPPASECSPPPIGLLSARPPTRLRASSTTTERSSCASSRAAASPAKPAPMTTTSACRRAGLRWRRAASATAGPASAPAPAIAPAATTSRRVRPEPSIESANSSKWPPASAPVVSAYDAVVLLEAERGQVADVSRQLAAEGLVLGTSGNVSARSGAQVAVTPTGAVLADLEPEQVTVVDLDGRHVDGELAPTSEVELHLGIYRRYDAGAVVHTHSPMATTLSCVLDEVPCVHYGMLQLGGPVPVAPYETFGTPELASVVLDALEGRRAALMANHGAIVHAGDAAEALELSLLLEWACSVYWRAAAIGEPRALGEAERQAVVEAALARGYGTTRRVDEEG